MMILPDIAERAIANFVFAHGAGAGKDSEFMQQISCGVSAQQINVWRFDFPYIQIMQAQGKRRPPDKMDILLGHFTAVIESLDNGLPLFIGGKSMGGRVASMLLENTSARGCICLGYPFHPPGKPEKLRIDHLQSLTKPMLVVQGQRDSFGTQQEVSQYPLSQQVKKVFLADGDHSFKPRIKSGFCHQQHIQEAVTQLTKFIHQHAQEKICL